MSCLIGYSGFVGSNLRYDLNFTDLYNSSNIDSICGKHYNLIVCAGISAKKWYANTHPESDKTDINNLLDKLKQVTTDKFVLISTIDVYDNINCELTEDYTITNSAHYYGQHRLEVELFVKQRFNHLIIRLPALFGYGLRKNIIYDYLNSDPNINLESQFQWYYLGDLASDIQQALKLNITTLNLFPEPIPNSELVRLFDRDLGIVWDNKITYNTKTKYTESGYWKDKQYIITCLKKYLFSMTSNRLIISNLAWKQEDNIREILADYGIRKLEIAPYKFFGKLASEIDINCVTKDNIYSMQAVLYPLTANLFIDSDQELLFDYFNCLFQIAQKLGVSLLVFGSPKNRFGTDWDLAVGFFRKLGDLAAKFNLVVCLEPNPKVYGCNFIINSIEGRKFILEVNSPNIRLHLDTGCMFLEGEDIFQRIVDNLDILEHVHFSAPNLDLLASNPEIDYNNLLSRVFSVYKKTVSIELLNQANRDIIIDIRKLLR